MIHLKKLFSGKKPKKWLVTGACGFIGSHLVEALLTYGQDVTAIDNFSNGSRKTLAILKKLKTNGGKFTFFEGDLRDRKFCSEITQKIDVVLHQAAMGSVSRSMKDPLLYLDHNVNGFVNLIVAADQAGVKRFVYASSSSIYGSSQELPKREDRIGYALSPYALTKRIDELYADLFSRIGSMNFVGLRYFNVFGSRQNPNGEYAAVIPRWIEATAQGKSVTIFGDGKTSRDFCFVGNVVEANLLGATVTDKKALNQVYNVGLGKSTSLIDLLGLIQEGVIKVEGSVKKVKPTKKGFRSGDIRHSNADIGKIRKYLKYSGQYDLKAGLDLTIPFYLKS